ncbi:MAG: serine/threonine protein kinase [Phycisphaerae bacterium]|nr:serine/threonine protein kinase [Phycisphaerae bacterium]
MTPAQLQRAEALFFVVRDAAPADRDAALATEPDAAVRASVAAMLEAPARDFLSSPILGVGVLAALAGDADPLVGGTIGPYHVERLLGAGGMGAVYLGARADGAYEQRVAIKVVKRGMDTDDLLRRFRAERRTLANLRHPNIAALHDGGSLPDGRPYLVMEYVDGHPLGEFCAERGLATAERLRLFVAVCRAVEFAHKNLVVHRDLKPGNILVTADGVPKLLDFGIAKVLDEDGAMTVTGMDQRRLTPEYASPEQVEGRPVTTAADVYSLGVILYELLVGRTPYRFETRSTAEILRVITSTTPEPPSAAVTRASPARGAVATTRLRRELRGDLDTIVLMAIRKEPERRYASAEHLAADIERHLRGLPVTARRDTLGYRAAKLVRRQPLASAATLAAALLAISGVLAIAWQSRALRRERDAAFIARDQQEAIAKFLRDTLTTANPFAGSDETSVRHVLDEAAARIDGELRAQPVVQASLRSAIGTAYLGLADFDAARTHLRGAYEQRLAILGPRHHDTAESLVDLATLHYSLQDLAEAERMLREALAIFREIRGSHNPDIARVLNNLGAVLNAQRRTIEAAEVLQLAIRMREPDGDTLDLAESLNNYGSTLRTMGRLEESESLVTRALAIRRSLLGEEHALVAQATANLAVMALARGDAARAEPLFRRALVLEENSLGKDHPDRAYTLSSYAALLRGRGEHATAESLDREALRLREAALAPHDQRLLRSRLALAEDLAALGRRDEAQSLLRASLDLAESPHLSPEQRRRVYAAAAATLRALGDATGAAEYDAKAAAR